MPVAINPGQRPQQVREEKRDPLDTILKGLQVAVGVAGIVEGRDKMKMLEAQRAEDLKAKQFAQAGQEADLSTKGFQKQTGPDGNVSFMRPPDYEDLGEKKIRADIAKTEAETLAIKSGKGKPVDPMVEEIRHMRLAQMKREAEEAAFKKTPEGRLKHLASSDKQRLDNAKAGLVAVQGMADALQGGSNTFSVVGDNDFTQQRTVFEEALGRMQSGGAITKYEEKRFRDMAPTWRDSAEIQQKKLIQLQAEMQSRLNSLGFKPDELGVAVTNIPASRGSGGSIMRPPSARASTDAPDMISPEDARAELIRRRGMKGSLPK